MTGLLVARVTDGLREQIATGVFEPGSRLPSEARLCDDFGVSRITVRSALDFLRRSGLVESRKGSGSFVTNDRRIVVGVFPGAVTALARAGSEIERTLTGFGIVAAPARVRSALDLKPSERVLRVERVHLVDSVKFEHVETFVNARWGRRLARADVVTAGVWVALRDLGVDIDHAEQSIAAELLDDDLARALDAGDSLALVVERRSFSGTSPVAFSRHTYVADRARLDVEFRGAAASLPPNVTTKARTRLR